MDRSRKLLRALVALIGITVFSIALYNLLVAEADGLDRVFCASVAFALVIFIVAACGRIGLAFLLVGALASCVRYAGLLKLNYLHEPLMGPDLRYFLNTTTLEVIAHLCHIAG